VTPPKKLSPIRLYDRFLIPTWYRETPREGELVADLKLADRIQPAGASA
jgi:hypothetical protein